VRVNAKPKFKGVFVFSLKTLQRNPFDPLAFTTKGQSGFFVFGFGGLKIGGQKMTPTKNFILERTHTQGRFLSVFINPAL